MRMLRENDVADLLGVSDRTIRQWRAEGCGPPFLSVARSIRYDEARVLQWIDENTSTGGPVEPSEARKGALDALAASLP